jgi:hypothetical protein
MEYQISHLTNIIEKMRNELIQLGNHKSFTDPDVVKLSQRLDRVLNEYQELQDNLKCGTTWFEWFESDDLPRPVRYCIDDNKVS